jgi:hypothetical protein
MTGPLRPSIEYVLWFCNDIREKLPECKMYILYWKTTDEDKKRLEEVFDKVFAVPEPEHDLQYSVRVQCYSSPTVYKLYYGIRCIIDSLNLDDSEIVMRIRTDNYFGKFDTIPTPGPNQFLFCPKELCGGCDWFGISTFETLKKVYYMNDKEYEIRIPTAWNPEQVVINNAKLHNVEMVSINSICKLGLTRAYPDLKIDYLDQ